MLLVPMAAQAEEPPVVVIQAPEPPAAPREAEAPPPPPEKPLPTDGLELGLGSTAFVPNIARMTFSGMGTPVGSDQPTRFRQSGRQLGLSSPTMVGGEIGIRYQQRYFAVGLVGILAGNPGGSDITPVPPNSPGAKLVDVGQLVSYGGGIDFAGAIPLGAVTFRFGGVMGLRGFDLPIVGYKLTTCRGKGGPYPCNEYASTGAQMFLEPRLTLQYSPMRQGFFVGGYVGAEVANGFEPTVGLYIGFHTSHEALAH